MNTALDKDIILKDILHQKLQKKAEFIRCFERLLCDYDGKIGDPKYFILVGDEIYFVDDRKANIVFATSLNDVTKLELVPTPRNLGLSDSHRIEATIFVVFNTKPITQQESLHQLPDTSNIGTEDQVLVSEQTEFSATINDPQNSSSVTESKSNFCCPRKKEVNLDISGSSEPIKNSNNSNGSAKVVTFSSPETDDKEDKSVSDPVKTGCCKGKASSPALESSKSAISSDKNISKASEKADIENGVQFPDVHGIPKNVIIPTASMKTVDENGFASFHLYSGYFGRSASYLHLRNAWQQTKLRRTMYMDAEYSEANAPKAKSLSNGDVLSPFSIPESEIRRLFHCLRSDILSSRGNIKQLFKNLYELKLALDRQYPLKGHFWESEELFNFLVRLLGDYLPREPRLETPVQFRIHELDLCILIFQIISSVFQGTDHMSSRDKVLKFEQGIKIQKLIRLSAMKIHTNVTDFTYNPSNFQIEHRLVEEILVEKTAFLFYLLTYLRGTVPSVAQIQMLSNNSLILTELRVLQLLALESGFLDYVRDLVKYILYTVAQQQIGGKHTSDSDNAEQESDYYLTPYHVVKLYYSFFILNVVLENNADIRKQLSGQFREDFKFSVNEDRLEMCILPHLPIKDAFVALVSRVRDMMIY